MTKDRLYLLQPGFFNAGMGPMYCSDSVSVEGMLSFFPKLRELVEVKYLAFPRPRADLISALGEGHQGLPVLILVDYRKVKDPDLMPESSNGRSFFADERKIRQYLSTQYDFPQVSQ